MRQLNFHMVSRSLTLPGATQDIAPVKNPALTMKKVKGRVCGGVDQS